MTVDLDWDDTYVVRRVFTRGPKTWVKDEQRGVYADEVRETAYPCVRNGPWGDGVEGYWTGK